MLIITWRGSFEETLLLRKSWLIILKSQHLWRIIWIYERGKLSLDCIRINSFSPFCKQWCATLWMNLMTFTNTSIKCQIFTSSNKGAYTRPFHFGYLSKTWRVVKGEKSLHIGALPTTNSWKFETLVLWLSDVI